MVSHKKKLSSIKLIYRKRNQPCILSWIPNILFENDLSQFNKKVHHYSKKNYTHWNTIISHSIETNQIKKIVISYKFSNKIHKIKKRENFILDNCYSNNIKYKTKAKRSLIYFTSYWQVCL